MADSQQDLDEVKALQSRIERAERDWNRHKKRVEDCYKLALPWRHAQGQDSRPGENLDDIYDSTAMTLVEDFAAEMLATYTPTKSSWVKLAPTSGAAFKDAAYRRQFEEDLAAYHGALFGEMQRSNLFQGLQEGYLDLAVGTMAMWIQDRDIAQPIWCQSTPATDLLIDRGPWGEVDGRWRRRKMRADEFRILWPNVEKQALVDAGIWYDDKDQMGAGKEIQVTDGIYRDWTANQEKWLYRVMVGSRILYRQDWTGEGSCPLIVARWSRDSTTAWGIGPLYRSLPDIKTLNHVRYLGLKNLDAVVDPAMSYEDDGVINLEHGVSPGKWIPRALGSEKPEPIESKARFDVQWAETDDLRAAIRRAHYQDMPDQRGKTPPTAEQHRYEQAQKLRRMGTPSTNLVQELQYAIVKRFAYLLGKRGVLPKVRLNGEEISLTPTSELSQIQEREEALRLEEAIATGGALFGPEAMQVFVNVQRSLDFIFRKRGTEVQALNSQAEIQQSVERMAQMAAQMQGGAPS